MHTQEYKAPPARSFNEETISSAAVGELWFVALSVSPLKIYAHMCKMDLARVEQKTNGHGH